MLRLSRATGASSCLVILLLCCGGSAQADTWDLNLGRLCQIFVERGGPLDCGGGYDPSTHGAIKGVVPDNPAFRSLMSEMGAIFAPNILAPSDTQGYGGFSANVEFGWTMVNTKKNSADYTFQNPSDRTSSATMKGHRFWRAAESVSNKAFVHGNIRDPQYSSEIERLDNELPSGFAPTITVMMRKGLWLPAPSFEMGIGVRHLLGSRMWAPVGTVKVALHEGFQGWPFPAVAARGSVARVVGSPEFNLTVIGLDFSISKHFGVASTFNLTPYVGYQLLWMIADSEVVDATPGVDAMYEMYKDKNAPFNDKPTSWSQCRLPDCNGSFAFDDQSNITRHRVFAGFKLNFYIASLLLEYTVFLKGSTTDQIIQAQGLTGTPLTSSIPDSAGLQHNINLSLGFDY